MSAHHVWIITGPAGSGKSTVAKYLARELGLPYIEGDDFHPQANVDKMSKGVPLNDADRWDWLKILREQALQALASGSAGAVATCSALKRSYRNVIRDIPATEGDVRVHFIYLKVDEEVLLERVRARQGHYMKDDMVKSQINSLEEPSSDEQDCLIINVSGTADQVSEATMQAVAKKLADAQG